MTSNTFSKLFYIISFIIAIVLCAFITFDLPSANDLNDFIYSDFGWRIALLGVALILTLMLWHDNFRPFISRKWRQWMIFIIAALGAFAVLTSNASASSFKAAKAYRYMHSINGYHEVKNRKALQSRIGVNPKRVPWCGFVIKWAVQKAGGNPPNSAGRAKAWERFGTGVSKHKIRKGYVVTRYSKYAGSGRHVGMAGGSPKGGKVLVCSGNTKNQVRCVNWSLNSIASARKW